MCAKARICLQKAEVFGSCLRNGKTEDMIGGQCAWGEGEGGVCKDPELGSSRPLKEQRLPVTEIESSGCC